MQRTAALLFIASGREGHYLPSSWAFSSVPSSSITDTSHHPLHIRHEHPHHHRTALSSLPEDVVEDYDANEDGVSLPLLFIEQPTVPSSIQSSHPSSGIPRSLESSIERVKQQALSDSTDGSNNNALHKLIVEAGIQWSNKRNQQHDDIGTVSYASMERVPGCIATVHLKTTLVPTSTDQFTDGNNSPSDYRVVIDGAADAMLSGGLVALLSDVLSGGVDVNGSIANRVTAADILELQPEVLTTAMDLQSILSRGRNDGMASMVRVVQRQIRSLLEPVTSGDPGVSEVLDATISNKMDISKDTTRKPTVAMLLSGGVDSSVAMHLLLRQNYNVTAFYLRIWLEDELSHLGECPWEDDLQVCQSVCEHAGNVSLETVSLGKEYRERVVQYTIEEAQRGRTPNPDIMCNSRVKFGCFLEYIEESGMDFDYVASGHYAQLKDDDDTSAISQKRLFRAPDPVKDQSYFLCALTQKQLSKVIFPIGEYQKSEVRELATQFQLPNRNRPDSQGLCFLGKVRFDDFLASYLGDRPGDVVDALNGEVIGRHNGLWYHTVGQRKGIGKVMFPLATAKGPWYVVAKDQERDIVYVSNRYDEDDFAQARSEFEVEDVRWLAGEAPMNAHHEKSWHEVRLDMKIRHGPRVVQGTLMLKDDGSVGNIRLDQKDGGLAPGQYVVFYQPDTLECLGAAVISEKHWASFLQRYDEIVATKTEA